MAMPNTKADHAAQLAAFWLIGVAAGFRARRGYPSWLDRREFCKHEQTAREVAGGGTFRGPLVIYDLIAYVEKVSLYLHPPLRFGL
jgi:hypothetical protein